MAAATNMFYSEDVWTFNKTKKKKKELKSSSTPQCSGLSKSQALRGHMTRSADPFCFAVPLWDETKMIAQSPMPNRNDSCYATSGKMIYSKVTVSCNCLDAVGSYTAAFESSLAF